LYKKTILILTILLLIAAPVNTVTEEEVVLEEHFYRGRVLEVNETEEQEHEYYTVVESKR